MRHYVYLKCINNFSVSFIEIFQKSVKSFISAGFDDNDAYKYATGCFFGGVIFMLVSRCWKYESKINYVTN